MRFLGIGNCCDLGDMYLRLAAQGHEVRIHIGDESAGDPFSGMLTRVDDWRSELDWVRRAGDDGIILFESASAGAEQDGLRRDGFHVIGGSAFGDRLEGERAFAASLLASRGLRMAPVHHFTSFEDGIAYVARTGGRYVYKLNGHGWSSTRTYVGELDDGRDMVALLRSQRARWTEPHPPDFVLMTHLQGIEMGVGAYFTGRDFLLPACLDWEHKRFFPGDLGELTGEMGTLVTYEHSAAMFAETLARLAPDLRDGGYIGYVNLNTIVNADGVWPLEFTCRFGYPGYAILDPLQIDGWADLFRTMTRRTSVSFRTHPGYCLGVVLTVPPYPYSSTGSGAVGSGAPILFRRDPGPVPADGYHLCEAMMQEGELVTSDGIGWIMTVTGRGATADLARRAAYERVRNVVVPKLRYREDIGARFIADEESRLRKLGWLG